MLMEEITTGNSIDEAVAAAVELLGVAKEELTIEVLTEPKYSIFGKVKEMAKIKATYETKESKKSDIAKDYLTSVLSAMGLSNFTISVNETEEGSHGILNIEGEGLGVIIGRRGETLDALQYLTSLVANKIGGDYYRVTVDSGEYRTKREKTLVRLAEKLSKTVLRTGRSTTLEPMNPYERRIIHSVVSEIEGVSSKSIGEEPNRKVVISSLNPKRGNRRPRQENNDKHRYSDEVPTKSMNLSKVGQTSYEAEYVRSEKTEREKQAKLYEKIEL